MSADNWAICPWCKVKAEADSRKAKLDAGKLYGKATPEAFLEALGKANQPVALEQTFREDYGIGITEEGAFSVSYTGHCNVCRHGHEFKHENILLKP